MAAASFWLWLWTAGGAIQFRDSAGYLALARALQEGHAAVAERPDRTPGYPLFLIGCGRLAALGGWDQLSVAAFVQTILLSGLGTWLVFDVGRRLGGLPVAVGAALIYATDIDVQVFGRYVMSEAQAVVLTVGVTWLRIRDGHWRRARWAAAALALTRPNLACVAGGMAGLEILRGEVRPAFALVWPTAVALVAWVLFAQATGGKPIDASRRIQALCQFGTAYEAELWRALPPGEPRTTVERAWNKRRRAYGAASALTGQRRVWNPGADWHPIAAAASAMIRADPLGYAWARLSLIPAVHHDPASAWSILANAGSPQALNVWLVLARIAQPYQSMFYGSFGLFAVLLAVALRNGWGWIDAVDPMRWIVAPLLFIVWVSTAMLSLSNYEIGRLGLPAHPLTALVWALVVARGAGIALKDWA